MQFQTQLRRARITYAILMACCTCCIMSAVTTRLLTPEEFWQRWPKVLGIDLVIAIPLTILLGPLIRRACNRLYPGIRK